ncbi:hypothetical protein Tco_1399984 [Tanacetum coccineum]
MSKTPGPLFQDGPEDGVPAWRPGLWPPPPIRHRSNLPSVDGGPAYAVPHRPGRIAGTIRFPPRQFQALLTLFSKSFSSFPRVLVAIGLRHVFSLDGIYALLGLHPKTTPSRRQRPRGATGYRARRGLTLSGAPFRDLGPVALKDLSRLQFGQL